MTIFNYTKGNGRTVMVEVDERVIFHPWNKNLVRCFNLTDNDCINIPTDIVLAKVASQEQDMSCKKWRGIKKC